MYAVNLPPPMFSNAARTSRRRPTGVLSSTVHAVVLRNITATVREFGLTLVPECGELVASVAEVAADWLEGGQGGE